MSIAYQSLSIANSFPNLPFFSCNCRAKAQYPQLYFWGHHKRNSSSSSKRISKSRISSSNVNWVKVDNVVPTNPFAQNDYGDEFIVLNFYHFVFIQDPEDVVSSHLSFLQGRDIHGRIYLNEQGINAQYSGPSKDALSYVEWVKDDPRFADILIQISPAPNGHTFPRLKLRYKPSLVQLEGGISHLPLLEPLMRATPLTPSEWRNRVQAANEGKSSAALEIDTSYVILDVRNGYEWDVGHFEGAQRPNVDCFRSTSFGLSEEETISDPLASVDKENTNVFMYCTGGIRCDVYSTILRQKGFKRLYTLKGGVSHYLEKEGSVGWVGNLFVFDSRLSLPPSMYKPDAKDVLSSKPTSQVGPFAKCHICGSEVHELRHRNCANIDCNLLFLCCVTCINYLKGCCCSKCVSAPRLRPVLPGHQRYKKWHIYRDMSCKSEGRLEKNSLHDLEIVQ